MARVDVVVVAFNSGDHLRGCVAPLVEIPDVSVVVVDNASTDDTLATIDGLNVMIVARGTNDGFAAGCNAGWMLGSAPFVLFLNPDATIDRRSLLRLTDALEADERAALVAPRIEHPNGTIAHSLRRFPSLRSTYARALFLHRLVPSGAWSDDMVRDPGAYERRHSPEWVSGACVLVRRSALVEIDGWDDRFFLYREDVDLCRRLRDAGWTILFEPGSVAVHVEGASSPAGSTLPLLAASRIEYARKHSSRWQAALERVGVALEALTHSIVSRGGIRQRRGHLRSLRVALSHRPNHADAFRDG
jgi:GT2 family glycosyltransferase